MPNQLKIGQIVTPTVANGGITPGCIACFPCRQATTDTVLANIAQPLVTGEAGVAFVPGTAFASPQGLLTADAASTDTTMRLSLANFTYSYNNSDTLLIATRLKITSALPGATKPIWAQGGNNSSAQGLGLRCKTTGALFVQLDGASQFFSADTDAGGPAGNGLLTAAVWHHVVVALWGMNAAAGTGNVGIWINGEKGFITNEKALTSWPATITPAEGFRIGQYYRTSGPTTLSIGATQSDFHIYRAPQSVIYTGAQMREIANRLYRDPSRPLSTSEWRMA